MTEFKANLNEYEWLGLVPAGGRGTRLGKLTTKRAKPSLAVSFSETGEITRMIDVPLRAIRGIGGVAVVSRCFAPETLDFITRYNGVETVTSHIEDSPIDTFLAHMDMIENSRVAHIGLIPGDTNITSTVIEEMRSFLDVTEADAILLATRHLEGHNIRPIDEVGMMCAPGEVADYIGDMGIHIFNREWLLERLRACINDDPNKPREVWNDIYDVDQPKGRVYLHVPAHDLIDVDMGTLPAFREIVTRFNIQHMDANHNIIFPGAALNSESVSCLAFPDSVSLYALARAIVPEAVVVATSDDYIQI